MAKEKSIKTNLTYSITFEDIEREIKKMEKLANIEGDVGKQAKNIIVLFKNIKDVLKSYGEDIPTEALKGIEKDLKTISRTINSLSTADPFNSANKSIEELNKQLMEAEKRIRGLKGRVTSRKNALDAAEALRDKTAITGTKSERTREKLVTASPELQSAVGNVKDPWKAIQRKAIVKDGATEEQNALAEESLKIIAQIVQEEQAAKESKEALTKATNDYTLALKNLEEQIKKRDAILKESESAYRQEQAEGLEKTKEFVLMKEQELSAVTLTAQASGAATVKVNTETEKLAGTFQNATSKIIKFSIVYQALKRILRESIRTIREMDESITGMMVVTGKTREEVESYIGAIKDVSAVTSTAMTDVANLVTEYVRQGRTMRDALLMAEETAKAAKIAGISTADSLIYMTSAINGFNLAVSDATRVSDIFANLAAVSATDYEQLAVALSKVSAQANMAGMSIEYTTALLAKGIEVTQEAPESIGTALKTVIARMRELTDYGKTLEDGMGVNRVEAALKAAGIELRTVNGEFRELEDVFNELGPRWDSLNSNVRQTIAQAVAGTRQQSRFVAIMQDWTRTQELATEAQDSAGASAAQYAQYSTGIEAAITRMTTAWQGFIQSLTSSKVIIGLINTVSKIINGITSVLESFGGVSKTLFIVLTTVTLINNVFSKMKAIMENFGSKGVEKERQMLILAQQRRMETEKALIKEQEMLKAEKERLQASLIPAEGAAPLSEEKEIETKERILAIEQEITQTQLARTTVGADIKANEDSYSEALKETVSSSVALNNEYIRRLKLKRESLEADIQSLEASKSATKDLKEQERIENKIKNLKAAQGNIDVKIKNLNEKNNKLLSGTMKSYQKIGQLLTTKISMAFDSIFSKLGPIGDMLSGLVMTTIQWGMGLISSLFTKKQIGNEDKKNLAINVTGTAVDAAKVGLTKAEGKAEEEVTEEKVKQAGQERKGFLASLKGLLFKKLGLGLTKKQTQATQKEAAASVQDAGADSASSAAKIPYVGWAIALGILAMFGLVAGLGALSAGAADEALAKSKQQKTEAELGEKQTTLYEKKKENRDLQKDQERYNELANKSVRTEEEKTEMGELIESMRQVDESWKNMTDSTLLKEVSKKIGENTSQINSLIDSNYETALKMRNLDKSVVGQQAITAKLIREQDRLIRTNEKLIALNDPQVTEKVEAVVTSGLEDIVAKTDYSKLEKLQEEDVRWDDYLKNIAIGAEVGRAAWSVVPIVGNIAGLISGAITGLAYTISEDIDNERKQEKEQRNLETLWRDASVKLVDVATTMEIERSQENTSIARQTAAYNKALEDNKIDPNVDSLAKSVIDSQYSTVSFIATLTKGNNQVLDNIEKLTSAGRVTEESILQMAKVFADLQNTDLSYKKAEVLIKKASKLDLGKHDDLSDLALEYLGKSTNFTMQELRDAMMATVKKGDEDAPKKDFRDNYDERGGHGVNNAEFTRAIEHIDKIISLVGGNLTEESIKKLADTMSGANAGDMFTQLMNTLGEATLEGEPTIEAQQKSWEEAYTEGRTKVDEFIQNREEIAAILQESADSDYEKYKKAQEAGNEDEATKYLKSATTARQQAAIFLTEAKTLDTQVSEGFRLMRGDLTTTELKDMVAAYTSEKKKINELKEALINETELSDEQYDKIEDVMAFMQDKDPTFDTLEFMKQVQEGSIEAINTLNEYGNDLIEKNLKKMESNVWTKQNALDEIEAKLKIETDTEERKRLEVQKKAAERNLARAKIEMKNVEKGLQKLDAKAQREQKLSDLQRQLDIANEKSITETYDKRLLLMDEMEKIYKDLLEEEYERAAKQNGYTKEQLKDYVAALKSTDEIADNMEIISNFTADQVKDFNRSLEAVLDLENSLDDIAENRKADTTAWYEEQIDYQNQIIDAYKSQLEKEKDLLQESLDKRKTLYQKYFDFLDQEDEETDFESEQKRLQDTIAKLSTASDAGSLARLKEAQEELADLEKDRLKTERQQRRDAIDVGIEAKSKAIDDEFERITSNAQGMWETVSQMPGEQIESLMTTYNDEFQNATDLNKEYLLLSYAELWANVKRMAGDEDAAKRLDQRAEAIRNLQVARNSGDAEAIAAAQKALNAIPYEDGGKVTHTGLAMVHGTPSKPEAFLNATQTMLLSNLGANLQNMAIMMRSGSAISTDTNHSALSIEDFTINISANMTNDQNIQRTGETLAEIFFERIQAGGIPVNRKR